MAATDSSLRLPLAEQIRGEKRLLCCLPARVWFGWRIATSQQLWKRSDYARAPDSVPRVPKTASIALFRFKEPSTAVLN